MTSSVPLSRELQEARANTDGIVHNALRPTLQLAAAEFNHIIDIVVNVLKPELRKTRSQLSTTAQSLIQAIVEMPDILKNKSEQLIEQSLKGLQLMVLALPFANQHALLQSHWPAAIIYPKTNANTAAKINVYFFGSFPNVQQNPPELKWNGISYKPKNATLVKLEFEVSVKDIISQTGTLTFPYYNDQYPITIHDLPSSPGVVEQEYQYQERHVKSVNEPFEYQTSIKKECERFNDALKCMKDAGHMTPEEFKQKEQKYEAKTLTYPYPLPIGYELVPDSIKLTADYQTRTPILQNPMTMGNPTHSLVQSGPMMPGQDAIVYGVTTPKESQIRFRISYDMQLKTPVLQAKKSVTTADWGQAVVLPQQNSEKLSVVDFRGKRYQIVSNTVNALFTAKLNNEEWTIQFQNPDGYEKLKMNEMAAYIPPTPPLSSPPGSPSSSNTPTTRARGKSNSSPETEPKTNIKDTCIAIGIWLLASSILCTTAAYLNSGRVKKLTK